jgi:Domain of unknown function DUF29
MATTIKARYDTDFAEWADHTAAMVRAGRFDEVDREHLAEEIEDLGKSQRASVESLLFQIIFHQAKRKLQPQRARSSWRTSILTSQPKIERKLTDSPSLRPFLLKELDTIYGRSVRAARLATQVETDQLPKRCPFTLRQLIEEFDLDWPKE